MPTPFERYQWRLDRPSTRKLPDLLVGSRPKHVLFAQQYDRALLDELGRTADRIRVLSQKSSTAAALRNLLAHKRALLYFAQPSTRSFLSFTASCQLLGMSTSEIRDLPLSQDHGEEPPLDALRLMSSYADLIVIRSTVPKLAECSAYLMNDMDVLNRRSVHVVDGGLGGDENPTQGLIDLFTIRWAFGAGAPEDYGFPDRFLELQQRHPELLPGPDGKTYVFVGDLGGESAVRSLCILLTNFTGVQMRFVSPPSVELRIQPELREWLRSRGIHATEHQSLDEAIEEADILYSTQISSDPSSPVSQVTAQQIEACSLTPERVRRMKDYAVILHPFPRSGEIPSVIDDDPRALYLKQARNGTWVRAAVIAYLFGVEAAIQEIHDASMHG